MGSVQKTLGVNVVEIINLDSPAGSVIVTMQGTGTPAESYVTADGTDPIIPVDGVEVTGSQRVLPAVAGFQKVMHPQMQNSTDANGISPPGMNIGQIRLRSLGTPTITVEW